MFLNEVKREEELFYSISNFLAKFSHKTDIEKKDVVYIKSKMIESGNFTDILGMMKYVGKHVGEFRDINRPENIYRSLGGFEIAFCVWVKMDLLRDVSELCNLLLIKQYYKNFRIFIFIQGKQEDYHKVSHFLSTMSGEESFYNSIYYQCLPGEHIQRLQKRSIGALKHFLPVQKVNHELLKLFTASISDYIPREWFEALLTGKRDWEKVSEKEILYGSLTLLSKNRKCFAEDFMQETISMFMSLNVLSWFLFTYTLGEFSRKKKMIEMKQLKAFLQQMQLYASGCLQLLENIVFHAQPREGIFSFRICSGESEYILKKYKEKDNDTPFLEVIIADYSDGLHQYNLAENFVEHIENPELKQLFADLTPADFFRGGLTNAQLQKSRERWVSYYEIKDNIGKHFGIRIFENIVRQSRGSFILESHAGHRSKKGESQRKKKDEECLPGTEYTILLPVRELQRQLLHTEIGVDKNIDIESEIAQYLNYRIIDKELRGVDVAYESEEEKKAVINGLADKIAKKCEKENPQVWFIKASGWKEVCGELLCKAILLSKINIYDMPHLVIYDCENDFIHACIQTISAVFRNLESAYTLSGNGFQIALFEKDTYEEVILVPDDPKQTVWLNEQMNFSRSIIPNFTDIDAADSESVSGITTQIIPFDALYPVRIKRETKTLFEYYTQKVIERDIQERAYGCKISDTHMRLGSTVHVNMFYEAELLFGNKLFVSRFAYLIVKDLSEKLKGVTKLTLYGYATYSELLVFEVMNIIKKAFSITDIDYAILEREMENRGDSHVDRIRYSHYEASETGRREYFKDRSLVCIVPIASTLKTNEKLIRLFCSHNGEVCAKNIIEHYALILVGPDKKNDYWKIKKDNRIDSQREEWRGIKPKYFVKVPAAYEDAMECTMCFPSNVLLEKPLIEVNAASTIPNQSFGLYRNVKPETAIPEWKEIDKEQSKLACLKDSMVYSHVRRGENHFLYYFQTEKLSVQYNREIESWLETIREKVTIRDDEYHVIFCPSHFSNAGYLELINRIVFHNAAIIIRDDVDKEYRSNIMAKYSNIHLLFEQLENNLKYAKTIKFYFVDDSIITGRTFWRSKSLVEAVAGLYMGSYKKNKVHVFEKIFVLIDRNSSYSKMQYLRCWDSTNKTMDAVKEDFFAFRSVRISSLRNHGDSCVLCKLNKEAEILYTASSTIGMSQHWKKEKEKFRVKSLKKYLLEIENLGDEKKERAYRRLVCTHTIHTYINERTHGNYQEKAAESIVQLLLTDYVNRTGEEFEYFLSYLKVISRPFIVFNKSMKQAVFDILLLLTEQQMSGRRMQDILESMGEEKEYLQKETIKETLLQLEEKILCRITDPEDKKDFILVLLKQLTELKSNYIIRLKNMNKIANYANGLQEEKAASFYDKYIRLVKLLIGVNSDTSKSAWLDYTLHHEKEYKSRKRIPISLPKFVIERMYLENTRVLFDGVKKLCALFSLDESIMTAFCGPVNKSDQDVQEEKTQVALIEKVEEVQAALTDYQFGNFKQVLKDYQYIDLEKDKKSQGIYRAIFTDKGKKWIFSSMLLFQLLNEEAEDESEEAEKQRIQEEILEKCHFVVVLLKNILQADKVKIVMEADAEYNEWIKVVCGHYNDLTAQFQKLHSKERIADLNIPLQKEYILLADSKSRGNSMQDFELDIVSRLRKYRKCAKNSEYGYKLDEKENYLIWEMDGGQEHPIFIYAELGETADAWSRRNNIRNSMMFNHLLNEKIFSNNNGGQLYELITNSRDLRMSNRSKAYSHTKNDVRLKQYEQACNADKYQKYYRSNVLTLLADLNVSEIYRKSLKKDYYLDSCKIRLIRWQDSTSIFNKGIDFYVMDKTSEPLQIEVSYEKKFPEDKEISSMDELLCYNVAKAGREVNLLLYSLLLNAGVTGRSQVKDHKVTVYFSKTQDGNLRMANLAGQDQRDEDEINEELKCPPTNEEKGISLWSMSRYIKGIIYSMLYSTYRDLLQNLEFCKKEDILEYRRNIENLLGNEYEVKVSWISCGEEKYFSLEIPVLAKKYQRFLKPFKAKQAGEGKNEEISAD